jgi:predicted phosphodiesterase
MKIIALGDTHGRRIWKSIVATHKYDRIVLIGDYFDSKEGITPEQQIENFSDLIRFKLENKSKVILLLGNHDYHYLRFANDTYKGFQKSHHHEIQEMLHFAIDNKLVQMSFLHDTILFTHAGVTNTWLRNNHYDFVTPIDKFLNQLFITHPLSYAFTIGENFSPNGDDISQTPIWVRPNSLFEDAFEDYIQVVGHTPKNKLHILNKKIYLIDTLHKSGEFLCIEQGEVSICKVEEASINREG